MESRYSSSFFGLVAVLALFVSLIPVVNAQLFTQSYCSSQNTGSDSDIYSWPWQSNGNCTNHCNQEGTYAFAVLQFQDCWCSNYIPADQDDISNCQGDCPGFPDEKCGNKDDNLFMYIKMDGKPSGTKGASRPTTSAAAPSSEAPTLQAPTSEEPEPTSTLRTSKSASSTPEPTEEPEPTTTEEPRTVPTVVTESGVIVTRTIVLTPTAVPVAESSEKKSNTGPIVGGVVGGVLGLLAIVGGILFVLWRRRKQQAPQDGGQDGSAGISRNVSTMSRAGLLGGGRSEKTPPPIVTNLGSQRSRNDDESVTPITPSTRRLSQPILVDSRLNPNAVLTFHGASQSRESLGSIDDSRDYGRQLNVRNPDPYP